MLTKAGKNADWIEAHLRIPDGPHVDEWLVLAPFMREDLHAINANKGDGSYVGPAEEEDLLLAAPDLDLAAGDGEALKLAMERARALTTEEGRSRGEQLDKMLEQGRSWVRVAMFAACVCQKKTLELRPSDVPPCHVNDVNTLRKAERDAAKLLRRMLAHGVSKWHPSPMQAIEQAQRRGG